jgi:hypothetical protein
VNVDSGIVHLGSVDHTPFFQENDPYHCYYYGYGVRRGVFIEDHVYAISEGGVSVHAMASLSTPVASLALPALQNEYCYY